MYTLTIQCIAAEIKRIHLNLPCLNSWRKAVHNRHIFISVFISSNSFHVEISAFKCPIISTSLWWWLMSPGARRGRCENAFLKQCRVFPLNLKTGMHLSWMTPIVKSSLPVTQTFWKKKSRPLQNGPPRFQVQLLCVIILSYAFVSFFFASGEIWGVDLWGVLLQKFGHCCRTFCQVQTAGGAVGHPGSELAVFPVGWRSCYQPQVRDVTESSEQVLYPLMYISI